jgi:putative aldouronate transport system permease protein
MMSKTAGAHPPVHNKIKDSAADSMLYLVVGSILVLISVLFVYPLIYVVSSSFSSPEAVKNGRVLLWPVDPGLRGYAAVFNHKQILSGYRNTIFYTVVGTFINVGMTILAAYPLSRKDFPFRGFFTFLFVFTMFFGGGMIPTYILIVQLGLINTVWSILLPGAVAAYYMVIVRTFFVSSIPSSLLEAAQIDGCSDAGYFFRILLPLSKAVIAVITLFYAVGRWNSYFSAMLYLNDQELWPLQIILRNILVANKVNLSEIKDPKLLAGKMGMEDLLKFSLIIASSAPIMVMYPFVQKYFIQGVMIGSIKG